MNGKQKKRGRPKSSTRIISKSSQEGTKEGYTRATFIMREDYLKRIKAQANREQKEIKQVLEEVLAGHFKKKKSKSIRKK